MYWLSNMISLKIREYASDNSDEMHISLEVFFDFFGNFCCMNNAVFLLKRDKECSSVH